MSSARSSSPSTDQSSKTQTRSNPIAIARPPAEKVKDPSGFETDEDDDDDASVDVVERDAIRLRKKYGSSIVQVSSSYQPGMTAEESPSILSGTLLRAPYLGSLSRSESHVSSLPPISLSDEQSMYKYDEDPPTEITSYGSLRESHQRGTFLDGPSSYREPHSGQLRRLDRNRGPGGLSRSHQPTISIGERIQQNQKRNSTLKQSSEPTNDIASTSGLSIVLGNASKDTVTEDQKEGTERLEPLKLPSTNGEEQMLHHLSAFGGEDEEAYDKFDPPTMMSSSMTAFEVLHSTSYQQKLTNYEIRDEKFQPLSRSMSDPTPHHILRNPMQSPTLQQYNVPPDRMTVASPALTANAAQNDIPAFWAASSFMGGVMVGDGSLPPIIGASPSSQDEAHDPDTDAAFDMDME
jgi:hypothetical protein